MQKFNIVIFLKKKIRDPFIKFFRNHKNGWNPADDIFNQWKFILKMAALFYGDKKNSLDVKTRQEDKSLAKTKTRK